MNNYKSEQLNELFAALSKAQEEMKVAAKDSNNPFFKSKYANLQAIIEAARPALCKNGLSVIQQIAPNESGHECLVTILGHSSGQWISSQMRITPAKSDVQSLGSCITYLRRYCYATLVGVYDGEDDGEDDDGSEAVMGIKKDDLVTVKQAEKLERDLRKAGQLEQTLAHFKISHTSQLKVAEAQRLFERLGTTHQFNSHIQE